MNKTKGGICFSCNAKNFKDGLCLKHYVGSRAIPMIVGKPELPNNVPMPSYTGFNPLVYIHKSQLDSFLVSCGDA